MPPHQRGRETTVRSIDGFWFGLQRTDLASKGDRTGHRPRYLDATQQREPLQPSTAQRFVSGSLFPARGKCTLGWRLTAKALACIQLRPPLVGPLEATRHRLGSRSLLDTGDPNRGRTPDTTK